MPERHINFPGEEEEIQRNQDHAETGDQGVRRKLIKPESLAAFPPKSSRTYMNEKDAGKKRNK